MSANYLEKLSLHKELLVTSFFAIGCLALSAIFPADNTFQSISKNIFFLVVLPILYIKLVLKDSLAQWGWNLGNKKIGISLAALGLLASLLLFYLVIRFTTFSTHYTLSPLVENSFGFFLLYELVFFNIFFFTQEFFFKGFLLSSFRQFSYWAVILQFSIYLAIVLLSKSPFLQAAPLIFFSLVGGIIAKKSHSFFYSYISGLLFIIILDAYIIHLIK